MATANSEIIRVIKIVRRMMILKEVKDEKQNMGLDDVRCFQSGKLQQFQSVDATIKSFIYYVK